MPITDPLVAVPVGTLAVICLLAGLATPSWPLAPVVTTVLIVVAYASLLMVAGIWYAVCPDCGPLLGDHGRGTISFFRLAFSCGMYAMGILVANWTGAALAVALAWFRKPRIERRPEESSK